MSFDASRVAYDRYMGRYSDQLAHRLIAFTDVPHDSRVLDVGCGPGALTQPIAERVGAANVAAADPSPSFVRACSERVPGADVRQASAADLPWADASFDLVLSQLVLNFLPDAEAGLAQMCRVARPGGVVGSCTWDYAGRMQMLRTFWDAALELDPAAPDEARAMHLYTEQELRDLWAGAGLTDTHTARLEVATEYADFDDYWQPFTLGVGPGGAYAATLDAHRLGRLREACFSRLGSPDGSFSLTAVAVAVRGRMG